MIADLTSGTQSVILLAGALAGGGIALLVDSLVRRDRRSAGTDSRSLSGRTVRRLRGFGTRLPIAVLVGLFILTVTAWPVAALAAVAMILAWPALMGGARAERQQAERLEALALWTESLRDTIAGAVGLEQAVIATSRAAPAPIAEEIVTLADRLRVRVPLPTALHRLADDLDDASADLVVAALLLNARLRGPGLRQVLTSLADSVRAEVEMRGRVTAGRAATRRSVQIVVAVTLVFVLGLRTFNPAYVEPYRDPAGQAVMAIVVGFFAAGFLWLKQLATYDLPERFMHSSGSSEEVAR
ncbi:type II secretion system F family protein [Kineosporia succinea]|uniref:Flp pilus assembly protein TadB n=1 Tax=Kineosporia succinea TaxID=84632 RepID=A0ABT9P5K4_9ACTN|nr:type II secretion system F family protein [Kineosporia succinea]MDP9827699.1 Flp pilus assembly protein TadB [Kineosporia succinea]